MIKTFTALAAVVCLSFAPFSVALAHEEGAAAMQSSPQAESQPFDVQFLDTMAKHHEEGIKMFEMGAEKAQHPELKAMAQKMVDDQKKEIPELRSLRDQVKAGAPEAVNRNLPGMMQMDMSMLETATGHEFDHQFAEMTIKHHKGAVEMSDTAIQKAQTEQVKNKAQQIHDKQKAEIAELEKVLSELKGNRS